MTVRPEEIPFIKPNSEPGSTRDIKWMNDITKRVGALDYNYSTTPRRTGRKWIDGKDIWVVVIENGALPNTTSQITAHNISGIDRVLPTTIGMFDNGSNFAPMPYVNAGIGGFSSHTEFYITKTNVIIVTAQDLTAYNAVIIMEYTPL